MTFLGDELKASGELPKMTKVEIFDKLLNNAIILGENDINHACSLLLGAYLRGTLHQITDTVQKRFELVGLVAQSILSFPFKDEL